MAPTQVEHEEVDAELPKSQEDYLPSEGVEDEA